MRILLIYPGNTFSTFDVAHGYEKALAVLGHTVRPYKYHASLEFFLGAIQLWREKYPDLPLRENEHFILASQFAVIEAMDFVPDVVLIVAGTAMHRRASDLLHSLGLPLALILTESPYQDDSQINVINNGHFAAAFTNDRDSVRPLSEACGAEIVYLPHSFDPDTHRPMKVNEEHQTNIFFHGTLWKERRAAFAALDGLPGVMISGIDPDDVDGTVYEAMPNEEVARYYNGTKIALNGHRDGAAGWSLGPRAYEIAACGAFQLCDDTRPELRQVFADTVVTYRDARDLRQKAEYYLDHEAERREMAEMARGLVQPCTFEQRAKDIVIPTLMEVI
jgi:spore maturation protein CgeB